MNKEEKEQCLYEAYKYTSNFDFSRLDKYEEANDDVCIDDIILDYTMLYEFHREEIEKLNRMLDRAIDMSTNREEKLESLRQINEEHKKINGELRVDNDRLNNIVNELKWKPIEEYDKGNYDWVLVKYFDGDYECIPCVAEKRFGKWHSIDEKEIQFDVKYFMDMQQIDKLQELKGSDK